MPVLAFFVNMEIAWITPKWPYPITDGARVATTQLLKNLSLRKIKIHLYAIIPQGDEVDLPQAKVELGLSDITLIRRVPSTGIQKLLSALKHPFRPITLAPYATRAVKQEFSSQLSKRKFDLVVYDGLHAAAWTFPTSSALAPGTVEAYRAHNVESEIWFRAALECGNPFKRLGLFLQGLLVKRLEVRLSQRSQFVFPVSLNDAEKFRTYSNSGKILPLPIGMQGPSKTSTASQEITPLPRYVFFVGRLDWAPNRDGLEWILKNVWPSVAKNSRGLSLVIAGSGNSSWLKPYLTLPGIQFLGPVQHLAPYYKDCIATLVPIFYGSGTRVKAIEASLHGRVCVSTQLGVEGIGLIPGESYYRAESADEWIEVLTSIEPEHARAVGARARSHAEKTFDAGRISEDFIRFIS